MNKWFYGLVLAGAGLILCRDAATLAAAGLTPDHARVQLSSADHVDHRER